MLIVIALVALTVCGPGIPSAPSVASGSSQQELSLPTAATDAPGDGEAKATSASTVSIKTKDELLIAGSFWEPKGKGRAPGALLVHAAGSDRKTLEELGEYLSKRGFAVLTIDLRGHGGSVSANANWDKAADDKARDALWALAARDVLAAAEYLQGRSEVMTTNLTVVGVGSGCSLAMRHALTDNNARALVMVTPEALSFGFNNAENIVKLAGLPTMIIASNKDRDIADRLRAVAHEANQGISFVEVSLVRSETAEVLTDNKLNNSAATWLREQVMPKK